ncbi:hypothetical protein [Rubidibacter lacunae]|uniref:hypothetical protein n=1 Tax=Rubidibacter lacunae TaxID=582514 RepID=UPI0012EBD0DF|nr:hypothetical protein [Rubidibacter lacunae]
MKSLTIQGVIVSFLSILLFLISTGPVRSLIERNYVLDCSLESSNEKDTCKKRNEKRMGNVEDVFSLLEAIAITLGIGGGGISFAGRARIGDIWTPKFLPGPDREDVEDANNNTFANLETSDSVIQDWDGNFEED